MRILLHSCCGPCTTYPVSLLMAQGHTVEGLFFNPNIYPETEEKKRRKVYEDWVKLLGVKIHHSEVCYNEWLSAISGDTYKTGRCYKCYLARLCHTAKVASENSCEVFTSTLLVSPYQDHKLLIKAMEEASRKYDIPYYYQDFRVGYKRSREMARGNHMYMQKYCGCEFSMGGDY
jgi:predicted adenine nucleotide alpha hydrolase (AANH) superfamily ATPase